MLWARARHHKSSLLDSCEHASHQHATQQMSRRRAGANGAKTHIPAHCGLD